MPDNSRDPVDSFIASVGSYIPDLSMGDEVDKFADAVDHHIHEIAATILQYPIANSIRESIQSSSWLYEQLEPPPPPPPPTLQQVGFLKWSAGLISRHRVAVTVTVAFFGTGAFLYWRGRKTSQARRKARRSRDGTKTEVVVLAGSAFSPLTKSLAQDLERRNFIVYVPVASPSEASVLQEEASADIRALDLDITSDDSSRVIRQFAERFAPSQSPTRSSSSPLHLVALLVLPSIESPSAALQTITPSEWSDAVNVKLVAPFTTIQAFLPLLQSQSSTVAFLTRSVSSFLAPRGHAVESIMAAAYQRYIHSLRRETAPGLNVVEIKMSSFDYGSDAMGAAEERNACQSQIVPRSEMMAWNPLRRTRYVREQLGLRPKESKGTSLRQLHHSVFDAIMRGKGESGTIFVGNGSRMYHLIGQWAPEGLVGWMMGNGRSESTVVEEEMAKGSEAGNSSDGWEDVHG